MEGNRVESVALEQGGEPMPCRQDRPRVGDARLAHNFNVHTGLAQLGGEASFEAECEVRPDGRRHMTEPRERGQLSFDPTEQVSGINVQQIHGRSLG
jgi:hypothetical protein